MGCLFGCFRASGDGGDAKGAGDRTRPWPPRRRRRRSNRLVCLRRDRVIYRAFVSVDEVLDLCVTDVECEPRLVNDAGLCVCVCPFVRMVRARGLGHRRGTRSPPCSSEKVPNHFFVQSAVPYCPLLILEVEWWSSVLSFAHS
jgi:hypothetical protein